jgi:hypothetical protein
LGEEACKDLKTEQAKLVDAGARKDMEKGPEWAKSNLPPERLAGIARLIEVEEGISFRCPRPRPVVVAVPTPADPAAGADDKTGKAVKKKGATKQVEVPNIDWDLLGLDTPKQPVPKKKNPAVVTKKPPPRDDFAAPAPADTSAAPAAATPK